MKKLKLLDINEGKYSDIEKLEAEGYEPVAYKNRYIAFTREYPDPIVEVIEERDKWKEMFIESSNQCSMLQIQIDNMSRLLDKIGYTP